MSKNASNKPARPGSPMNEQRAGTFAVDSVHEEYDLNP